MLGEGAGKFDAGQESKILEKKFSIANPHIIQKTWLQSTSDTEAIVMLIYLLTIYTLCVCVCLCSAHTIFGAWMY